MKHGLPVDEAPCFLHLFSSMKQRSLPDGGAEELRATRASKY